MHVKHCCWNDKVEKKKKGEIILFTVTCNLRGIKSSKVSVLTRLYKHTHAHAYTRLYETSLMYSYKDGKDTFIASER